MHYGWRHVINWQEQKRKFHLHQEQASCWFFYCIFCSFMFISFPILYNLVISFWRSRKPTTSLDRPPLAQEKQQTGSQITLNRLVLLGEQDHLCFNHGSYGMQCIVPVGRALTFFKQLAFHKLRGGAVKAEGGQSNVRLPSMPGACLRLYWQLAWHSREMCSHRRASRPEDSSQQPVDQQHVHTILTLFPMKEKHKRANDRTLNRRLLLGEQDWTMECIGMPM